MKSPYRKVVEGLGKSRERLGGKKKVGKKKVAKKKIAKKKKK
jgi:hypothetical protein